MAVNDVPIFTDEEPVTTEELFAFEDDVNKAPRQSAEQTALTAQLAATVQRQEEDLDYKQLVDQNKELINLGEEATLRLEARIRKQDAQKAATSDAAFVSLMDGNQEDAEAFLDLENTRELSQSLDGEKGYHALEELAVENLQNTEMLDDPDYGAAIQQGFSEDLGASVDIIKENTVKSLVFQQHLDKYKERLKEEGSLGLKEQIGEFAGIFLLPFYDTQGRLNANKAGVSEDVGFIDRIRPGKTIRRQIEGLFSLPLEEFEVEVAKVFDAAHQQSGVFGVNETLALSILEEYNRGTIGDLNVVFTDVATALDSTIVLAPLAKIATGSVKSLSGVAKVSGARTMAATIDTDSILATMRSGKPAAQEAVEESVAAIDHLIPSALKPATSLTDQSSIEISGTLANKLSELDEVAQQLEGITTQGRLSGPQLKELVDKKLIDIKNRNQNLAVEDYRAVTDPVTKVTRIESFLGKRGGGGYATEKAAKGAAARKGFDSAEVVEENGHFFIKQSDVVEELGPGGFPLVRRPDNSIEVIPASNPITAGIKSADLVLPPDLASRSIEAQMAGVKFREQIIKPLANDILSIGKKNLKSLNTVLTMSRQDRKWYNLDEFAIKWRKTTGKDPSEKDFVAYAASKTLNDIDYTIHNNHMYTSLARRGAKTANINNSVSGFKFDNLRVFEMSATPETAAKMRMFDVQDNIVRTGKGDTPAEELADLTSKLESGEYKVYRIQDGVKFEGDLVHNVLVPKDMIDIKPLARQVLNYTPGGHLFRRTKWFAKQPTIGKYKDGTEFVAGPRTMATYRTELTGAKHVEEINEALEAYRSLLAARTPGPSVGNALAKVAARTKIAESPFGSLENLEDMVSKGKIDPEHPFELVFDRGLPEFYFKKNLDEANRINLFADEAGDHVDGTLQWLKTTGRDYYGKRTEGLLSPHEELDTVLDPLVSLSKGIEHAAKTHAYDNYLNRSVEEWVRAASPFIKVEELGGITDARHIFYNGRLDEQLKITKPAVFNKLNETRVILQRQMGVQTPSQELFEGAKRNIARFIEANGGELGTKVVMKIDDIKSNNPINAINALVFDAWLGLFDVSQMFVQTQTVMTALAASPNYGAQAVTMLPAMRWMVTNQGDNLLDYIAKNGAKLHGQETSDFKDMVKAYRASGWNNPGGEISYLANHSNAIASSGVLHKIRQTRQHGRVFFNEAERWNRMTAWQIAWKETTQEFPELTKGSEEFLARVNKRTNDFSISMTSASNAKIQNGAFSPITRFMGYQMRLLEAMLPKQFGGNPNFSAQAKLGIIASQVLLYGSKGLPGGSRISDLVQDMHRNATGEQMDPVAAKFVESGSIDGLLYLLSEGKLNTDFAERTGFGRGLDYTFDRMSDGSMASMMEFVGGPGYSFTSRYAESVGRVVNYFRGTRGPLDLDKQDALFVLDELMVKHINSLKRAQKGLTIMRLGQVTDPRTGEALFDATELEGYAALIGIPLYGETEARQLQQKLRDHQEEVREIGTLVSKLDLEAFRLMGEGEFEQAELVQRQVALIIASYQGDPRLKQQIADFATRRRGWKKPEYDRLLEQVQSRLGPEELPAVPITFEEE